MRHAFTPCELATETLVALFLPLPRTVFMSDGTKGLAILTAEEAPRCPP